MPSARRNWLTTDGFDELDRIAKEKLGIELHKWQREATARLLSGIDVLSIVATGSGKSTIFQLYALARPEDVVLVISPLKLLQSNMVSNMQNKTDLKPIALNADSISSAKQAGRDLWTECADGHYQIVLCAPEQLDSSKMKELLDNNNFQRRLSLVVVDEAHLIPIWGGDGSAVAFRSAFHTIGSLRSRLRLETAYLALSATLMPGKPTSIVRECLGFRLPRFELIREDCERTNLHTFFRRISRSASRTFPSLDWLVLSTIKNPADIPKTIIYIDHIMKGHDLVTYLRSLLPTALQPQAHLIIRHLHGSTCTQCKEEASDEFLKIGDLSVLRIIVATEAFGCGVDIRDVARVVNYGTPRNTNILLQRFGRNARNGEDGFCYCYIGQKLWDSLSRELGLLPRVEPKRGSVAEKDGEDENDELEPAECCIYLKQILEAHLRRQCITRCINALYQNPIDGKPDSCMRCSGCVEDQIPPPRPVPKRDRSKIVGRPLGDSQNKEENDGIPCFSLRGLRKPLKRDFDHVEQQIVNAARRTWVSVLPPKSAQFGGALGFLTKPQSTMLSRRLLDLQTSEHIRCALGNGWKFWDTHGEQLATQIIDIRTNFLSELRKGKDANISSALAIRQAEGTSEVVNDSGNHSEMESEDQNSSSASKHAPRSDGVGRTASGSRRSGKRKEREEDNGR